MPDFWLLEPLDGSKSRKPAPRPIWAQKPEFLVEIALSLGPAELARVQAKQGFGLFWAGTLKRENRHFGSPDLSSEPRPEAKTKQKLFLVFLEFACQFRAEADKRAP